MYLPALQILLALDLNDLSVGRRPFKGTKQLATSEHLWPIGWQEVCQPYFSITEPITAKAQKTTIVQGLYITACAIFPVVDGHALHINLLAKVKGQPWNIIHSCHAHVAIT
jgi:hypothetical protein